MTNPATIDQAELELELQLYLMATGAPMKHSNDKCDDCQWDGPCEVVCGQEVGE